MNRHPNNVNGNSPPPVGSGILHQDWRNRRDLETDGYCDTINQNLPQRFTGESVQGKPSVYDSGVHSAEYSVPRFHCHRPEYATFQARLDSLRQNRSQHPYIDISELADAGLFHVGPCDKVMCAFCLGKLYNWEKGDNPYEEHFNHFGQCEYIQHRVKTKRNALSSNHRPEPEFARLYASVGPSPSSNPPVNHTIESKIQTPLMKNDKISDFTQPSMSRNVPIQSNASYGSQFCSRPFNTSPSLSADTTSRDKFNGEGQNTTKGKVSEVVEGTVKGKVGELGDRNGAGDRSEGKVIEVASHSAAVQIVKQLGYSNSTIKQALTELHRKGITGNLNSSRLLDVIFSLEGSDDGFDDDEGGSDIEGASGGHSDERTVAYTAKNPVSRSNSNLSITNDLSSNEIPEQKFASGGPNALSSNNGSEPKFACGGLSPSSNPLVNHTSESKIQTPLVKNDKVEMSNKSNDRPEPEFACLYASGSPSPISNSLVNHSSESKIQTPLVKNGDINPTALEFQKTSVSAKSNPKAPTDKVRESKLSDPTYKKLSEEYSKLRRNVVCNSCGEEKIEILFLPCRHMVVCEQCSVSVDDCPKCDKRIIGTVKIFMI